MVGFLKTSVGGGIGLVLTPTLSLVLPAQVVLGLTAPLMNLADPISLRYYWRQWDRRQLWLLAPTTVLGVGVGTWLLTLLPGRWLNRTIAIVALVFAAIQLGVMLRRRRLFARVPHGSVGMVAGVLTGLASAVAHSGGVVMGLYLVSLELSNAAVVGTASAVIAISNVLKLAGYWQIGFLTPRILLAALAAVPALVVGAWLGYHVNRRLPRRWFELLLIGVSVAGALRLLFAS